MTALEIRLGPTDASPAPVDLSVRLTTPEQARDVAPRLPPSPLQSLLHDWADGVPTLRPIHSLWLEFDLHEDPGDTLPTPVVCARIAKGPYRRDVPWLLDELFPRLHGELTSAQRRWIRHGVEAIPPSCRLLYAFTLGARGAGAVRLEIYGEDLDELLRYLASVDPTLARIAEPAREPFTGVERLHVSFDVEPDGLGDRVGVEGSFRKQPAREPGWGEFFSRLRVGADTASSAMAWPGGSRREGRVLLRGLSHVKQSHDLDGVQPVKAYLTASPATIP